MSEENLEIVRRIYEGQARRDAATVLALYDPEVEADFSRVGFGWGDRTQDVCHGIDEMRSLYRGLVRGMGGLRRQPRRTNRCR